MVYFKVFGKILMEDLSCSDEEVANVGGHVERNSSLVHRAWRFFPGFPEYLV
jgi:hypothetical protein